MPIGKGLLQAKIDTASSGDNTIVAAVAGTKVFVYALWLWGGGAVSVTIKDGAAINLSGAMLLAAGSNPKWDFNLVEEPWFTTTSGNAFVINLSGAVQVSGRVYYAQVA